MRVLTVTQINTFLKSLIEGDGRLHDIYIRGEISNFTDHYRSGHLYFSLKDERSVLKAVMFASAARRLQFRPLDGMRVLVRGHVSVYEAGGQYQFYAEEMQPDGIGALSLAFEQLKEKLSKEGLFDAEHKRPLPKFPKRIGIITSPTGAAVQDMLQILARRWPAAKIVFQPVLVQGEGAPEQLIRAVQEMNAAKAADVILIGRGGGSAEDLAAFNDEGLARAVFASKIPVISAVGHETDFTICDFVADLRAPTPSAAAELAVPDMAEVAAQLSVLTARLRTAAWDGLDARRQALDILLSSGVLNDPKNLVESRRTALSETVRRMRFAAERRCAAEREQLAGVSARLDALSPLKVMARGYAAISKSDGKSIHSIHDTSVGETLNARLADGVLRLSVLEVKSICSAGKEDQHGKENEEL